MDNELCFCFVFDFVLTKCNEDVTIIRHHDKVNSTIAASSKGIEISNYWYLNNRNNLQQDIVSTFQIEWTLIGPFVCSNYNHITLVWIHVCECDTYVGMGIIYYTYMCTNTNARCFFPLFVSR